MKRTVLLAILFTFAGMIAKAQCTYPNQDFEDWNTFPLEYNGVTQEIQTPDNHFSVVRFFTTFILIDLVGDPYTFDLFENDPVAFYGIEKSTDASSGDYAVKLQNDPEINVCDLYTNMPCNEMADVFKIDIKHVGNTADTLYIFGAYDENLPPLAFDQAALDTMAGYFLDSIILDGNVDYTTYSWPVNVNDPNAPVDTFSFLAFTTTNPGNYFLLDNVQVLKLIDEDNDGYTSDVDCDDNNADVNPGATEVCNGLDDNCDGNVDEGLASTYYLDADGDSFGNLDMSVAACTPPANYVSIGGDCDDSNATVNPNGTETCNGLDDNCDGSVDEGLLNTYYSDADGDGFGDPLTTEQACSPSVNFVDNADDCNDNDGNEFPGQVWYADPDGDGYGDGSTDTSCVRPNGGFFAANELTAVDGDCEADNPVIYPGAVELCDGLDNDCNGTEDDNVMLQDYFLDADGDGFGAGAAVSSCLSPGPEYVLEAGDCDDTNAGVNPAATELCNGFDDNCNSDTDEGVTSTFYQDADGDGFGSSATTEQACDASAGFVNNSDDCDDASAATNPSATELCNGLDDNCDGNTDEGVTTIFYQDADGDSFGSSATTEQACDAPAGYVTNGDDCDDASAAINPSATEICNGLDDNCDGEVDEGVTTTFYQDADGDGFGNAATVASACDAPDGFVSNDDDCDDTDAGTYPGATEFCDSFDNDCDGQTDENVTSTFYLDSDNDGFGNPAITTMDCEPPTGYTFFGTDCDDSNSSIYPGATEIPNNGIDEDCDGQDLMTGTDELAHLNIQVFPNPFSDRIRLENLPATGYEVKLVNVFGQTLVVAADNSRIETHGLPAGTYYVQIAEQSTGHRKVVMVVKN